MPSVNPSCFPCTLANSWGSVELPTWQGHTQPLGPVGFLMSLLPLPMPWPLLPMNPMKGVGSTQKSLAPSYPDC